MVSKRKTNNRGRSFDDDQGFKELVHDSEILAAIIGGVIPEFQGMSRKEIITHLDVCGDGHTVRGRNPELISQSNGPVYMDSVFDVRSPLEGKMSIIVAIEGQGPQMSECNLYNRQIYYSSRLVSDQASDFPNKAELYRGLRKTTVVWVKLSPRAEDRNTIVRDFRVRSRSSEPEKILESPLDKTEIIEVNVGPYDESIRIELLGILGILFSHRMDESEKDSRLREKYQIGLRANILREAGNMGALAEEFELYGDEREEKGIEKGMELEKAEFIDHFVSVILDRYKQGRGTPDQIAEDIAVPPKHRELVLSKVKEVLSKEGE